jgi:hypothetical protein
MVSFKLMRKETTFVQSNSASIFLKFTL